MPNHLFVSECHVLGKAYEIGSIWYPDLGGLNEVNYCYQCECVPVSRQMITAKCQQKNENFSKPSTNFESVDFL